MTITSLFRRAGALALVALPLPALAQRTTPTVARLTPYVGYMSFGSFMNGPLGTQLTNQSAPVYGVQLGIDVAPNVAVVGNVGYSDSNLRIGVPILGGLSVGDSKVLMYDGGLQLRLPSALALGSGLVPWVEGGAGAMRFQVKTGPVTANSTNFAFNAGGGIDYQLSRSLGIRGMVKDYMGKFDFQEATGLSIGSKLSHNWVFGVGLNLGF
jgi:opacity protein-like surface antigen